MSFSGAFIAAGAILYTVGYTIKLLRGEDIFVRGSEYEEEQEVVQEQLNESLKAAERASKGKEEANE